MLDSKYLSYVINSPRGKAQVAGRLVGAAQQVFNTQTAAELEIPAPPLPVQRRIAGILSAYDVLMENSQRRIRLVETMARALYREWFVYFRFPGHEKLTCVASPLGDIPKGWEIALLSDLCGRMESGGTPKRTNSDYWDGGDIDWYKTHRHCGPKSGCFGAVVAPSGGSRLRSRIPRLESSVPAP